MKLKTKEQLVERVSKNRQIYEHCLINFGESHLNTTFSKICLSMAESDVRHFDWFND
jgi:hypothetical protein